MNVRALSLLVATLYLSGCAGIKFSDEKINKGLPDDFKNRNIYPETDILKYKLDSLAGRILVCKPDQIKDRIYDCDLKVKRIIKKDTAPEASAPKQKVYSSKIDRGASIQGSYLSFAASFSAEQAAELIITDSALVFINDNDIPIDDLKTYVQSNQRTGEERRFWIQGVLLATLIQRDLVKIKSDAEGVVGNTSGIKGGVYNQKDQESIDYRISMFMSDIDRDIDKGIEFLSQPSAKSHGIYIRSISGLNVLPEKSSN